jgi:capsular exopolysaccharide synthesis family protein
MTFRRQRAASARPPGVKDDGIVLGTRLKALLADAQRTLLFTGTAERDGVTTVAIQVALALAQMNEGDVLLVDAALRRPSLHETFDLSPAPGLSDVIVRKATLETAIHVSEFACLSVLPCGHSSVEPTSLLTSSGYADFLEDVRRGFRFILFDSSPVVTFPETALIAPRMDGVVLVAASGRRTRSEIREATQLLNGLRANLLGVALSQ